MLSAKVAFVTICVQRCIHTNTDINCTVVLSNCMLQFICVALQWLAVQVKQMFLFFFAVI
jgi:hypothetical protein